MHLHCRLGGANQPPRKQRQAQVDSCHGFEDAINKGVEKASLSLKNITGVRVMDQSVKVSKDGVSKYTVRMKVSFLLK